MSSRRGKRTLRLAIAIVIAVLLVWFVGPLAVAPILRHKLQSLVEDHLHATLHIGHLAYAPPYSLRVTGAKLVSAASTGNGMDVLDVAQVDLTLARFPLRRGPLLIERLVLRGPTVRLVRLPTGEVVGKDMVKREAPTPRESRLKLSDLFRLRQLTIEDGQIVIDDQARPQNVPMVWKNLGVNLNIVPRSAADYEFDFTAADAPVAKVSAAGAINIDTLLLELTKFSLQAQVDSNDRASPVPPPLQEIARAHALDGALNLTCKGELPIRDARAWHIDDLRGLVQLARGAGSIEFAGSFRNDWRGSSCTVMLHDVTHQPPQFPHAIEHASATLRLVDGNVVIENATARYGSDEGALASATIPLDDLSRQFRVRDIAGQVTFGTPPTPYPPMLAKLIDSLGPRGPFAIRGDYTLNQTFEGLKHEYEFIVSSEGGALAPTAKRIPIERVRGEVMITPTNIELRRIVGTLFGGAIDVTGTIDPRRPVSYQAQMTIRGADLAQVWQFFAIEGTTAAKITGRANATAVIAADNPDLIALRADGEVELFDAQLWQGKILSHVARESKIAQEALTPGEAAAVFHVEGARVELKQMALNSPALSIQGSGAVTFDGQLDLDLVAAPLGDWEKHLKKLEIPLVGDVAAAIVGGFQKMTTSATRQLLLEFRVTGTASQPKFEAVAAPVLTDGAARIFGAMMKKESGLIESLRERKAPPGK
jgi:hypothetical protein